MNKRKVLQLVPRRRKPSMKLIDHITAARDLREISRLLNDLILKFCRYGIITKGPCGNLHNCSNLIFKVRDHASNLLCNQYPNTPDLYFRQERDGR